MYIYIYVVTPGRTLRDGGVSSWFRFLAMACLFDSSVTPFHQLDCPREADKFIGMLSWHRIALLQMISIGPLNRLCLVSIQGLVYLVLNGTRRVKTPRCKWE